MNPLSMKSEYKDRYPDSSTEEVIQHVEEKLNTNTRNVQDYKDKWDRLKNAEKLFIIANPKEAMIIYEYSITAEKSTIEIFGYNGVNDFTDAYRHAFWNALCTKIIGKALTKDFMDAHEDFSEEEMDEVINGFSVREQVEMDLYNNEAGRNVVKWYDWFTSQETLSQRILNKLDAGELMILSVE